MTSRSLEGKRLLVVEDDYFLADEVVRLVTDLGAIPVGPAPSLEAGFQIVEQEPVDGALLDVNVGGEMVFPLARHLTDRGVPVLLATGYDAGTIPPEFSAVPRLSKPYDSSSFRQQIEAIVLNGAPLRDVPEQPKQAAAVEDSVPTTADEQPAPTADEGALRSALAQAHAEVRARDNFIATATHELRNPMTPVVAQVQRLIGQASQPGLPAAALLPGLELLDRAVDHFLRRATTLLEVSRITTGRLALQPAPVDLSDITCDAVHRYGPMAERAGTRLDDSGVTRGVHGVWDRVSVEQVLENLVSNAIKYAGGQPVSVALDVTEGWAVLSVQDRGVGMSSEDQARIFGRFEQAAGQRERGGFGVGLWLVQQLVDAMGGTIDVQSHPGEGSTFTVRLPGARFQEGAMSHDAQ